MSIPESLQSMENAAYRRAYSDGIIDLFVGLSLLWIGAAWVWAPDYSGLAGILPAVFSPVAITARKQYVEKRLGYVRWSEPRRKRERRSLIATVGVGVLLFVAAVGVFTIDRTSIDESVLTLIAPGLVAWLLALLTLAVAVLIDAWRFALYGVVLAVAGLITAVQDANPGWPMLAAGVVVVVTGTTMLVAFARSNPLEEGE